MMSKRGLLLCNLARQGINASSSEKQVLSKEECSEIGHKGCEVVPQQDNSKHNEKDLKVLEWLSDNQRIDNVEETTEQVKERTNNVEGTTEQVKERTDNVEETIATFKERAGNVEGTTEQVKEKIDSVEETIVTVNERTDNVKGTQTGETSQLGQNKTETSSEDFSGTDSDKDKDFVPDKGRKRKVIPSSSSTSSSSCSSTTSSSSDSVESTKSTNLLESNQTNTQLLDQEPPPIVQQLIATEELNTEMRSQFGCEFQNILVATKPKKKARNPAAWKQNKRKALKNTGQEHTNYSGKVIPAKTMGPPCTEKCLIICWKIISLEDRQKLFAAYWELGCY